MSFTKDPNDVLDYRWNWVNWLIDGDTIATSTMIPEPGIVVDSDDHDDTSAWVWLSGGTTGQTVRVTNRVTTAQGRTIDRTAAFHIRER
jgi:hypothetical protein